MAKKPPATIQVGQIWRDKDTRFERFIKVLEADDNDDKVRIITCDRTGKHKTGGNGRWAKRSRFGTDYKLAGA
jgi:hypothetical protein